MEAARTLELVLVSVDQRIGRELGGYRILEEIGRGGTSVVYRAEHVRLGRTAALKLLSPGFGEADFSDRFLRESRLAASLDHSNIVPVYDAGEQDGLLYIAMAHVEGTDLKTLIAEEGRLPVRRALRILGQVASALDAAHARGLVHRDVKPANILVGADDRVFLSDIGYVLIEVHRFRDALPFARKAYRRTSEYPLHAYATFNLGYVLLQLGHCRESIRLFQAALPHEPKEQQPYVRNRI